MKSICQKLTVVLALSGVFFSGCSTMFNNGSQSIQVTASNGKEVKVNVTTPAGSYATKLPATIVAKPSTFRNVSIQVTDECYDPTVVEISKGITLSYWANILNFWGFLIDPLTGAMWQYNDMASVIVNKKADNPTMCKE